MQRKMKKTILTLVLAVALGTGTVVAWLLTAGPGGHAGGIRISGNIEISVTEVSFKLPGRVARRFVSEGERVEAGQTVAALDTSDLEQEAALRDAELRAARAFLAELEAGSRPEEISQSEAAARRARVRLAQLESGSRNQEVSAARAVVQRGAAELERTRADYERHRLLLEQDVISQREFEAHEAAFRVAAALHREGQEHFTLVQEGPRVEEIEQARETLREAEERLALVRNGPRAETIEQARARVEHAAAAAELARVRLGYATVTAPISGVVLSDHVEAGEFVAAGAPIVSIGALESTWLRGYIGETDLGRLKVGQSVTVSTDSHPSKTYAGVLSFISSEAEFTPKHVQTDKERVKLVYRVKVDIPNPALELKRGMPADAIIQTGEEER